VSPETQPDVHLIVEVNVAGGPGSPSFWANLGERASLLSHATVTHVLAASSPCAYTLPWNDEGELCLRRSRIFTSSSK
jgi:hypothetical protein